MSVTQTLYLPAQFAIQGKLLRNPIRQLRRPTFFDQAEISGDSGHSDLAREAFLPDGTRIILTSRRSVPVTESDSILITDFSRLDDRTNGARWLTPVPINPEGLTTSELSDQCARVCASWGGQFFYRTERHTMDGGTDFGLRSPQIGALHATLAHWTVTNDPATIVMPTGTGKTETMLAVLASQQLDRVLVVVPTAALRDQISMKFITFGLLKRLEVLGNDAACPIVGTLEHYLRSADDVGTYFRCCNVIVTTMSVISGCTDEVQRAMATMCDHLIIDEAHHISAPTWDWFRRFFHEKRILQFTATPFRTDGKRVDGKVIFNYPLRKAQEEDYFRPVTFRPVREYSRTHADIVIAEAAIAQLQGDLNAGHDHLLMARASDIQRATRIHEIYQTYAPEHTPLLIHSRLNDSEKRDALARMHDRRSRIIVCVDMLGEGFDLPELKIAALHDIHKSLAITLQFTGRFTRNKDTIGDATMIANIADPKVDESLRALYAEDADWNLLLRGLSEGATGRQVRHTDFLRGFTDIPQEIPLQNILPKMSTVVYQAPIESWRPDKARDAIKESQLYAGPTINHEQNVLLYVTCERERIPWGDIRELTNTTWHLYLLHWDRERKLLFINSSNNEGLHRDLAKAVLGDDMQIVRGDQAYRCLHGINRLILMNLGLSHSLGRALRFTFHVGADINEAITDAQLQNKDMSNLFGRGFENGEKTTLGCARKGRIWSHKIAEDITDWLDWCHAVGAKLLDERIDITEILRNTIRPTTITSRPPLVPLEIEWAEETLARSEEVIHVEVAGETLPFYEVGMELVDHCSEGPLRFRIFTDTKSVEYEVQFRQNSVEYATTGSEHVDVIVGRKRHGLSEWFQQEPPIIRFEDTSFLRYNDLFKVPRTGRLPFNPERILAWNWDGTNLKKESQSKEAESSEKRADSIQFRVIQELLSPDYDPVYDIVFDDDASNEAADVVAIKRAGDRLLVHLFHCKYSSEEYSGARVGDLYAVCGQAQRSVGWRSNVIGLFAHLRHREESYQEKYHASRFELGNLPLLEEIARASRLLRPEFRILIVQPGLSKRKVVEEADANLLDLLGSTQLYLQETHAIPFDVIGNQ